tara:strand:- start:3516 stop:4367 length:852 start_codon:yes stop_codon:yes gene_type:complete
MYNCLIFEGGGILGISYVGAIKYLNENNLLFNVNKFGGSSAGSQFAALLSLEYTIDEIEDLLLNQKMEEFKDGSFGFIRNILRLITNYGYYKGEYLYNYFDKLIEKKLYKKNATFLDLYNYNSNILKITGTCLNTQTSEVFDYISTPDMPIAKAIQISSCFPYFFKPVVYNKKTYIDGGCLKNLPKNIFDDDSDVDQCLVYELVGKNDDHNVEINNIIGYSLSIFNCIYLAANKCSMNADKVTLIQIDTGNYNILDLSIKKEDKEILIKSGYNATLNKLTHLQ